MNNHTEDTGGIVAEIKIEAHNNAIQSAIEVVQEFDGDMDTYADQQNIDDIISKLQSLKK